MNFNDYGLNSNEFDISIEDIQDHVHGNSIFGAGPQNALGNISDLISDSCIVDHSWLSNPETFYSNHSIAPVHKDLEEEWLQGDTLYGAFKLIKNTEPIVTQIKKNNLWDHSDITKDNLYHWSPPTNGRFDPIKKSSINVTQFYKKLLHRGYTGDTFETEAKKYMDSEIWSKTASKRAKLLDDHEGLMGNVYVDVTAFESCEDARRFTNKFNKTAKFVLKTFACDDCIFNKIGRCELLRKKIAFSKSVNDEVANSYLDYLKTVERIDDNFINKVSNLSVRDKLKTAFLHKKDIKVKEGGVKATLPPKKVVEIKTNDDVFKMVKGYIESGTPVRKIRANLAKVVDEYNFDSIVSKVVKNIPVVSVDVDECDSKTLKNSNLIKRASKCSGCVNDLGTHCKLSGTKFNEVLIPEIKTRQGGVKASTPEKVKLENRDVNKFIPKVAKAIESGASYNRMLKASNGKLTEPEFKKVFDAAMKVAKVASPDQFNNCDNKSFALSEEIKQGNKCSGCIFNEEFRCAKLKKAFTDIKSSTEVISAEVLADHHLYNSFYKDLDSSSLIDIKPVNKKIDKMDIQGLDEFNVEW